MNEEKVEQLLYEAKNKIPVDEDFKKRLRKSFEKKKNSKRNIITKITVGLAAAAVLLLAFLLPNNQPEQVFAEELLITNALSFVDIAQGDLTAIDHQNGQVYLAIQNEGIFRYTSKGLEKISDANADSISVNNEGTAMLYSSQGNIFQLNLLDHQQTILLKGSETIKLTNPIWKNDEEFVYTQQTENKKQVILESVKTEENSVLASSSDSTIGIADDFIVYEEQGKIIKKDLKNTATTVVDEGTMPSVSKDGHYIAYVKEQNGFEDLWIIDSNLKTTKKITNNIKQLDAEQPMYQYGLNVWDSEGSSLYFIKHRMTGEEITESRLTKIDLGTQQLSSSETVEQFLRALIVRDDDYAKSFMSNPPQFLTASNPRVTGFKILSTLKGKNEQVQVEVYSADGHLPYFEIAKLDIALQLENGEYKIQTIEEIGKTLVSSMDMENMELTVDGKQSNLFSLNELGIENANIRYSSIVYNEENQALLVGIQEMEPDHVLLYTYNVKDDKFTLLNQIPTTEGLVLTGMTQSANKQYLAINVFSSKTNKTSLYVINLESEEEPIVLDNAYSVCWNGNLLIYELLEGNHTTLHELSLKK